MDKSSLPAREKLSISKGRACKISRNVGLAIAFAELTNLINGILSNVTVAKTGFEQEQ